MIKVAVAAAAAEPAAKTEEDHSEMRLRKRVSSDKAKPETPNLEVESSESNLSSSEVSEEERKRLERLEKAQKMKLAIQVKLNSKCSSCLFCEKLFSKYSGCQNTKHVWYLSGQK